MASTPPQERYGFKPFIGSSHQWALQKLEGIALDASLLDIGPGSGFIAEKLRSRGITELYAVEISAEARAALAPLYRQISADVSAYQGSRFDVVLMLDVLEHTTDPVQFLQQVVALLKEGGQLLLSVPNVAHWSVRLPLLFGFFEYAERGILDRTHFQFFTRRRLYRMIADQGLDIVEANSSISPGELVLPHAVSNNALFRQLSRLRLIGARALPGIFAYQHLAVLRRRPF